MAMGGGDGHCMMEGAADAAGSALPDWAAVPPESVIGVAGGWVAGAVLAAGVEESDGGGSGAMPGMNPQPAKSRAAAASSSVDSRVERIIVWAVNPGVSWRREDLRRRSESGAAERIP